MRYASGSTWAARVSGLGKGGGGSREMKACMITETTCEHDHCVIMEQTRRLMQLRDN